MTIIHELAKQHQRRGSQTTVVVSRGTRHDYAIGSCIEVDATPHPTKVKKLIDVCCGRMGLQRLFGIRTYRAASDGIPSDSAAVIFVHNNPVAVSLIKRSHPAATVVLWAHNRLFDTYSDRETQKIVDFADGVICCSEYIGLNLNNRLRRSRSKVHVVLNGADVESFLPHDRTPDPQPTILFVGRVVPQKGPDLLVKAALELRKQGARFRLRLVGSSGFCATDPLSDFERNLRKLAEPVGEMVQFVPFKDRAEIIDEFRAASIFCVPSNWDDPSPLAIGEGLAAGLPVIAARRGGIPELGAEAVQYFSPPDVTVLTSILQSLLTDPEARRAWGAKARARAEQLAWKDQYQRLIQIVGGLTNPATTF